MVVSYYTLFDGSDEGDAHRALVRKLEEAFHLAGQVNDQTKWRGLIRAISEAGEAYTRIIQGFDWHTGTWADVEGVGRDKSTLAASVEKALFIAVQIEEPENIRGLLVTGLEAARGKLGDLTWHPERVPLFH